MRRIIVGFDGSEEARDALHLARSLVRSTGAELVVAAAFEPILPGPGVDLAGIEDGYFAGIFEKARAELGDADFERRELRDVSAPRGLDQIAEAEGVDLVVVGSTHRGKVGRVLFGSVGERLLYGAPRPVAVAPRGYADRDSSGFETIGIAYDGGAESELALASAKHLATALEARLRLITVIFEWLYVPETSPHRSLEEFMEAEREERRAMQRRAIEAIGDSIRIEGVLDEGDPASALADHAADVDLLVIGSRGYGPMRRTLLGGVSAEVMRTAPCPVIVVPRGVAGGEPAAEARLMSRAGATA